MCRWTGEQGYRGTARLDLTGEITNHNGMLRFRSGITEYPTIGDPVTALTSDELRVVFETPGAKTIKVGQLQQDSAIIVGVDVDELLSKHFAVLGTTGVGKSSAVALILQQVLQARPGPAHPAARRSQRIRPLLRRARLHRQSQATCGCRSGCSISRRSSTSSSAGGRRSTRRSRSSPRSSRSRRRPTRSTARRLNGWRSRSSIRRVSATPSTRRCPTGSPIF